MTAAEFDTTHGAALAQLETLLAGLPWGFRVDHYDGPRGRGFEIVVRVADGADTFQKTISHGPDTLTRSQDWARVDAVPLAEAEAKL